MLKSVVGAHFSDRLTSRGGAWLALGCAVTILLILMGVFAGAAAGSGHDEAPPDSESARAAAILATFPRADEQSVIVIASRSDGSRLTPSDMQAVDALKPVLQRQTGLAPSGPQVSEDGAAAVVVIPVKTGSNDSAVITDLRAAITAAAPAGLSVHVTGGPAFGVDIAAAFDGANFTLLAVTILIVAFLLIITYRSPILWLLPLTVVALADQAAGKVTAAVGSALDLQFDAGIISVLVFGAGTNYALLLLSRYREELAESADHRAAMSVAWRRTAGAIISSNVTVVLSLLTLALAVIPGTRGLGVASAVGLLIALAAVLFLLPPLMVVCGRKVFWPFVPKPGKALRYGRIWGSIAAAVSRRPGRSLAGGLLLLAIMATGLFGTSIGLTKAEQFRVQSDSAEGLSVLSQHFPPGEAQPMLIVAETAQAQHVAGAAAGVDGVVRAHVTGATADGAWTRIMVTGRYAPGTAEATGLVVNVRAAVHAVADANALVGGPAATAADVHAGNHRDLLLVAPLILVVSFLILLILLRSLVAPALLLFVNLASATAAIGAGAFFSRLLFGQPALDDQVPLLAFLFLVALGIDYTIFLVHRARIEARKHGTREGMVRAVAHTGGVITSAGIVLAAVFAALGVLPLVVLGQLGVIVGVGVIIDTLVVRTVIVPAIFETLGRRIWWPGKIDSGRSLDASTGRRDGRNADGGRTTDGTDEEGARHDEQRPVQPATTP